MISVLLLEDITVPFYINLNLYFKLFLKNVRNTLTMPLALEISKVSKNQN